MARCTVFWGTPQPPQFKIPLKDFPMFLSGYPDFEKPPIFVSWVSWPVQSVPSSRGVGPRPLQVILVTPIPMRDRSEALSWIRVRIRHGLRPKKDTPNRMGADTDEVCIEIQRRRRKANGVQLPICYILGAQQSKPGSPFAKVLDPLAVSQSRIRRHWPVSQPNSVQTSGPHVD